MNVISVASNRFLEWVKRDQAKPSQIAQSKATASHQRLTEPAQATNAAQPTPGGSLSSANVGDRIQIVSLDSDATSSRLRGMGLIPGVVLEVMSASANGPMVVALNHGRLGLGADMAERIQVIPLNESATAAVTTLQTLEIGSTARVAGYAATSGPYRRKLLAMGFTKGTEFTLARRAPLGDPVEVKVRGFRLSLRKHEADALLVTPVTKSMNQPANQSAKPFRQPLIGPGSSRG